MLAKQHKFLYYDIFKSTFIFRKLVHHTYIYIWLDIKTQYDTCTSILCETNSLFALQLKSLFFCYNSLELSYRTCFGVKYWELYIFDYFLTGSGSQLTPLPPFNILIIFYTARQCYIKFVMSHYVRESIAFPIYRMPNNSRI